MKKIVNIIGWIILIATFTSIGFATDNPKTGLIGYFIFFSLVFAGTLFYAKHHHRKSEVNQKVVDTLHKAIGAILVLCGTAVPVIFFRKFVDPNLAFFVYFIIVVITIIIVVLGALAISIINNSIGKKLSVTLLGYLMLIVLATIPAIGMSQYSNSYANLGIAYWAIIVTATTSWWGSSLYFQKD